MILYGTDQIEQRKDARSLLAAALRETYSLDELPEIRLLPQGKPVFASSLHIEFNLSHSEPLALCALDDRPVGVDIQLVKNWNPRLPQRVCSQAELDWLDRQPDRSLGFAVLWALKESRVKQSGIGLRLPLREISVPLPEHWDGPDSLDRLQFRAYTGENWAAAICGLSAPPDEILWRKLI